MRFMIPDAPHSGSSPVPAPGVGGRVDGPASKSVVCLPHSGMSFETDEESVRTPTSFCDWIRDEVHHYKVEHARRFVNLQFAWDGKRGQKLRDVIVRCVSRPATAGGPLRERCEFDARGDWPL